MLTANEYLAGRDAQTLEPLYRSLQLSVGVARELESAEVRQRMLRTGKLAYRIVSRAQRSAEHEDAALRKATSRQDSDWSESLHFTRMVE